MLRRKLLLVLGSLVVLLLAAAVSAILLLHDVLEDLTRVSTAAWSGPAELEEVDATIRALETALQQVARGRGPPGDDLLGAVDRLSEQVDGISASSSDWQDAAAHHRRLRESVSALAGHLEALAAVPSPPGAAAPSPQGAAGPADAALPAASALRAQITELGRTMQGRHERELEQAVTKFRWTALGVGIVFLLLINGSILVLLRTATMILKPVDELVEASRRLAREEFDHRVEFVRDDEFAELARAYNGLAAQLHSNEQRKIETLRQVARTLNHELNNAISIVELQLRSLAGKTGGDRRQSARLRQAHEALARMSHTVADLARVRRIVLTDYSSGVKMLDLQRSVQEEPVEGDHPASPALQRSHL
ncbi:MAG: HAMP domain-containing protein [Planctomycetota bacterium]|jgi:HAMP domain-containing protein